MKLTALNLVSGSVKRILVIVLKNKTNKEGLFMLQESMN